MKIGRLMNHARYRNALRRRKPYVSARLMKIEAQRRRERQIGFRLKQMFRRLLRRMGVPA